VTRTRAVLALAVLALGATTGCSGGKENFAVPGELCGAQVERGLTRKLLPSGDKLTIEKSGAKPAALRQYCDVVIDGDIELQVTGAWRPAGITAKQVAEKELTFNTESVDEGDYAVGHGGKAFTVVACGSARYKAGAFSYEARVVHPDGDMGDDLVKFLAAYARSYTATLPCD
jgi:hypothetical protein